MARRSDDKIVLLVDDDTAVRQMLARALAFEAFVVVEAANGLEALEQLRREQRQSFDSLV